jgi:hypothetical protein
VKIVLPQQINADGLIPFLTIIGVCPRVGDDVVIDFVQLHRVTPMGLVALVATIMGWRRGGCAVSFDGLTVCPIVAYLQRMDFFRVCGVDLPETFIRHESRGRFVPVRYIDHRVEEMGGEMASCLAPGGDDYEHPLSQLYALVWYVLTETANNVRQHSRGVGYVAAQVNGGEGFVRLAMADNGRGILKSFQEAGLPWSQDMEDSAAILKALEPRVSSRGRPANEGVGLTLTTELVRQISGWMIIVSGSGVLRIQEGGEPQLSVLPGNARYEGTLIGMTFRQRAVLDFAKLLQEAKIHSGLLQQSRNRIIFKP